MNLRKKDIPKSILKQIRYTREKGTSFRSYRIVREDGKLDPVRFHSIIGAAATLMGIWDNLD